MTSYINLIDRFNQPFPLDYGLDRNGRATEDFIDFMHSNDLYNIIKMNESGPLRAVSVLEFLGLLDPKVCLSSLDLSKMFLSDVEKLIHRYPYLENIYNYSKKNNLSYIFSAEDDQNFVYLYKKDSISNLKKCLKSRYNYIRLNLVLHYNPGFYGSQAIIDVNSKRAYLIDSTAITDESKIAEEIGLEAFLKEYIDPDILVEPFDSCPSFSVQKTSDLCGSIWSLYLFLLILLNPEYTRNEILNILREYSQEEQDLVILQFLYYLDSFDLKNKIPQFNALDTINKNHFTIPNFYL